MGDLDKCKGKRGISFEGWDTTGEFDRALNKLFVERVTEFLEECDLELTEYEPDGNTVSDDWLVNVYSNTEEHAIFSATLPDLLRDAAERQVWSYDGVERPLSPEQAEEMMTHVRRFRRVAEVAAELAAEVEAKIGNGSSDTMTHQEKQP